MSGNFSGGCSGSCVGRCDIVKNLVCNFCGYRGVCSVLQVEMFTSGYLRGGRGLESQGRVVLEH